MAKKQQMREYLYLGNLHGGGGGKNVTMAITSVMKSSERGEVGFCV